MESAQEKEFLAAFEEHSDALFRHALFRLGDREKALDATQDAYCKAWDYVVGGGEVQQYKSFLYRILHNLIIDEYRKKKSRSLDAMLEDEESAPVVERLLSEGSVVEAEELLDEKLSAEKVRDQIQFLPEHYRVALTLRFVDGFTPREIAQMIELSENVVSVRIHRGVLKLRELCKTTI